MTGTLSTLGTLISYGGSFLQGTNYIATNGTMTTCGKLYTYDGRVLCGTDQTGTATTPSGWTDDGTVVRLTTSTDNVGIGTTAPTSKLQVVGDVRATNLIIDSGAITGSALKLTYNGAPIGLSYTSGLITCSSTGSVINNNNPSNIGVDACTSNYVVAKCLVGGTVSGACECNTPATVKTNAPSSTFTGWLNNPAFAGWQCVCSGVADKTVYIQCAK